MNTVTLVKIFDEHGFLITVEVFREWGDAVKRKYELEDKYTINLFEARVQ